MGTTRAVPTSLHSLDFKQTACHIPHEGNVEQTFSRAGLLADPNMAPHRLANLVTIGVNKKSFNPSVDAIKDKYFLMFRGDQTEE